MTIDIDDFPDNIIVYRYINSSFVHIKSNAQAYSTLKMSIESCAMQDITTLFHDAKKSGLYDALLKVQTTALALEIDISIVDKNNQQAWRRYSIKKLSNGDIITFFKDVSDYKRINIQQQKLDRSEEIAHIGNWQWDIRSDIITWSDEVYRIFGEEPQSFIPSFKDFLSYLNEEDTVRLQTLIAETMKSKKPYIIEHEVFKKDGSSSFVRGMGSLEVNQSGEPISMWGTVYDISKERESLVKLQESEEKFRKISEVSLMGIFIYKEHYIYVNDAFSTISGYSLEEIYSMRPWEIVEKSKQSMFKQIAQRRLGGEEFSQDYTDIKFIHKDGSYRYMRVMTQTIFYKGSYSGLGTVIDITDIVETKEELTLLAQAIEQTDEMIRITDKDGINTYVNTALTAHTGYRSNELIGKNNSIFKSSKHNNAFYKKMWDTILAAKTYRGVFINRKKDGQIYYEEMIITPILDENNTIKNFVATSQDITTRTKIQEKLEKLATTDSLTSLFNRRATHKELDKRIMYYKRQEDSFALLMLDIDYFKKINDNFGHDQGDYVLRELSTLISSQIRDKDHLGRWGGEEFMLILPNVSKDKALNIAEKIRILISIYSFKSLPTITLSVGVTLFREDDKKEILLKRVDDALYRAKEEGRNCVVWG